MFTELNLKNFKSYKSEQAIPLKPLTLLFGPNGGGKSSIIQALATLKGILGNEDDDYVKQFTNFRDLDYSGIEEQIIEYNEELSKQEEEDSVNQRRKTLSITFNDFIYKSIDISDFNNLRPILFISKIRAEFIFFNNQSNPILELALFEINRKRFIKDSFSNELDKHVDNNCFFKIRAQEFESFGYETRVFDYKHPIWFSSLDINESLINKSEVFSFFNSITDSLKSENIFPNYKLESEGLEYNLLDLKSVKTQFDDDVEESLKSIFKIESEFTNTISMKLKDGSSFVPFIENPSGYHTPEIVTLLMCFVQPLTPIFGYEKYKVDDIEKKLQIGDVSKRDLFNLNYEYPLTKLANSINIPPIRKIPKKLQLIELRKDKGSDIDAYKRLFYGGLENLNEWHSYGSIIKTNNVIKTLSLNMMLVKTNSVLERKGLEEYQALGKKNKTNQKRNILLDVVNYMHHKVENSCKTLAAFYRTIGFDVDLERFNTQKKDGITEDLYLIDFYIKLEEISYGNSKLYDEIVIKSIDIFKNLLINLKDSENLSMKNVIGQYLDYFEYDYLFNEFEINNILYASKSKDEILVLDKKAKKLLRLNETGTGFSQLFPILIHAVLNTDSLICIEQPELHLHPALQAKLATVLIDSVVENHNQVIIETHSEHLIKAVQLEVAKFHASKGNEGISKDDVSMVYVSRHPQTGESMVREMKMDESGSFTEPWPDDFFESSSDLTYERLKITHQN